jgi:hypothetical protein
LSTQSSCHAFELPDHVSLGDGVILDGLGGDSPFQSIKAFHDSGNAGGAHWWVILALMVLALVTDSRTLTRCSSKR